MSTINRTADASMNRAALADMAVISKKLEKTQQQIHSGRAMQSYKDAGQNAHRMLTLEGSLLAMEKFETADVTINLRLQKMDTVVRQIQGIATDFRARLVKVTSFGPTDTVFREYCQNQLEAVENLLNTKDDDGRYLFAGEATEEAPVDMSLLPTPSLGDPVNYTYYKGTSTAPAALLGEGQVISYGITGEDSGFAKLIHALKIGATTVPDNDASSIAYQKLNHDALVYMEGASNELPDILQRIGTSMKEVEMSKARQDEIKEYTKGLLSDLTDANQVESIEALNRLQIALQCSFIATMKMNHGLEDILSVLRNMR